MVFGGFRGSYYDSSGRNAFIFGLWRPSAGKVSVKGEHNVVAEDFKQNAPIVAIAYCR